MSEKPEALRLADRLDHGIGTIDTDRSKAAAELRRLHVLTEELQENLEKKSVAIQRIWKERDELRTENEALKQRLAMNKDIRIAQQDLIGALNARSKT